MSYRPPLVCPHAEFGLTTSLTFRRSDLVHPRGARAPAETTRGTPAFARFRVLGRATGRASVLSTACALSSAGCSSVLARPRPHAAHTRWLAGRLLACTLRRHLRLPGVCAAGTTRFGKVRGLPNLGSRSDLILHDRVSMLGYPVSKSDHLKIITDRHMETARGDPDLTQRGPTCVAVRVHLPYRTQNRARPASEAAARPSSHLGGVSRSRLLRPSPAGAVRPMARRRCHTCPVRCVCNNRRAYDSRASPTVQAPLHRVVPTSDLLHSGLTIVCLHVHVHAM